MFESVKAGRIVRAAEKPTISDGTAGGIESDSVTFELCRQFVDDFILLEESDIEDAICFLYEREHLAVEGAASLAVAAVMKNPNRFHGQRVVGVVSGSRIDGSTLHRLGCRGTAGVGA